MGQQQSAPQHRPGPNSARRVEWWEALKLGAITAAVGALQWMKFALLTIEDTREEERRWHRGRRNNEQERSKLKEGLGALSPETRRALVFMIDQQLTPILVDQWRLGLAKAFLPEEVALPEGDPQLRQALLDSLKTYQEAQDRRTTFRQPPSQTPLPRQSAPTAPRQRPSAQPGPVRPSVAQPSAARPTRSGAAASSGGRGSSEVIAELPAASSSVAPTAPGFSPVSPSAPPMPQGLDQAGPSSLAAAFAEPEELLEDCSICMDHKVEVEVSGCHHQLCIECARAICCLEGRAPQCPFCRGPIDGVDPILI